MHDEGRAQGRAEARSPGWEAGAVTQGHMMSMVVVEIEVKTDIGVFAKEEL